MLYHVKLQYGYVIEARNRDEAYTKARQRLRDAPETAISKVEQYGTPAGDPGLITGLITGK